MTGLTREVAISDGEVLDLVQLAAEPKGYQGLLSIAPKCISVERPASESSAGSNALTTLLQGASKANTDDT